MGFKKEEAQSDGESGMILRRDGKQEKEGGRGRKKKKEKKQR